jgi:hypothetical protein
VYKAIEKGLVIIPVRAEDSGGSASDIARDTESMWSDLMIEKYARTETSNETAYWTNLNQIKLQRSAVRDALGNLNTLPARGSLLTEKNALKELISRVQGIIPN